MAKGKYTGTAASVLLLAADNNRDHLTIQALNATQLGIGVGVAAVADEGIQLYAKGDTVRLDGAEARAAIYIIGNGATGQYVTGDVWLNT
jgi:hypothetical protein